MRKGALIDPTFAVLLASIVAFSIVDARTSRTIREAGRFDVALPVVLTIGMGACCIAFGTGAIPLVVLFVVAWAVLLIAYLLCDGLSPRNLLVANTGTLCFVLACGLVFYSYMLVQSLLNNSASLAESLGPGIARNLLLTASLVLSCAFMLALGKLLGNLPTSSPRVNRTLRPLSLFLLFAMTNEILDALPMPLMTWFDLMPFFQLGGTLLLTLFCAVLSYATVRLGTEAFRESEGIALERRRREQETQMRLYQLQAETDQMTGLAARRKGQELLERLDREATPYVLAFIDADGLKRLNDKHGHAAGDRYLVAFADALAKAAGEATAVRWGGDEFVIVSEGGNARELQTRLDAIDVAIAVRGGNVPVRFSYGIASSTEGADADAVLDIADSRMYAAKHRVRPAAHTIGFPRPTEAGAP